MTNSTPELSREGRSQYLDVVKLLLTILVVGVHAAITYGAAGSWFFDDPLQNFPTSAALTFFNIYCQSFFMGLFFFISGLFTPRSIERKGPARFVLDRLVRLGIPLVVFFFIINPLTDYAGYRAAHPAGSASSGSCGWASSPSRTPAPDPCGSSRHCSSSRSSLRSLQWYSHRRSAGRCRP